MSIGVILTALTKREHIELEDFLFGDILSVERGDLGIVIVVSALLIILGFFLWRSLMIMSIDRDDAWLSGISVDLVDAVFHVILAVAVVLGANMLGIVLASAMLVIPATAAKALAHSFRGLTIITIILAEITMIGGLFLSRIFSLPSGAIIVLTGVLVLVFSACISRLRSA